jgi:hypothetical protein
MRNLFIILFLVSLVAACGKSSDSALPLSPVEGISESVLSRSNIAPYYKHFDVHSLFYEDDYELVALHRIEYTHGHCIQNCFVEVMVTRWKEYSIEEVWAVTISKFKTWETSVIGSRKAYRVKKEMNLILERFGDGELVEFLLDHYGPYPVTNVHMDNPSLLSEREEEYTSITFRRLVGDYIGVFDL